MVEAVLRQAPDGTELACGGCGAPLQNFKVEVRFWTSREQMMVMCAGEWTLQSGRPVDITLLEVECPKCGVLECGSEDDEDAEMDGDSDDAEKETGEALV